MKSTHFLLLLLLFFCFGMSNSILGQNELTEEGPNTSHLPNYNIGFSIGWDNPEYIHSFDYLNYSGGLKLGFFTNYFFSNSIGAGMDLDYIINRSESTLPSQIRYPSGLSAISTTSNNVSRIFLGLGPSYRLPLLSNRLKIIASARYGFSLITNGDIASSAIDPASMQKDYHLWHAGYDSQVFTAKYNIATTYNISNSLGIILGVYYMQHYGVNYDNSVIVDGISVDNLVYGVTDFTNIEGSLSPSERDALVVRETTCSGISSIGFTLGIAYSFGASGIKKNQIEGCEDCKCPNDNHKVIVTVKDGPSRKIIPNADVAIKDTEGNIIATGTTNSFGVVDFGQVPHGNYVVTGNVYGIATSTESLLEDEFAVGSIIQKSISYEDLRFILKGTTINKQSKAREPSVVVNLTNQGNEDVKQVTSDRQGEFAFRLDKNSSYRLVGIKQNRLSDIDRATTVGLNRSTTLFVDLELGLDNFNCDQGTVLDIKYEYDKADLLSESKFDLDRLVRYMVDHSITRVELSSHTDSRGSNEYNQSLSERRAQSAVSYIISRGINRSRITAIGYGENKLLNHCKDGVQCSDADHRINRRTEAKLICQ